MRADLLLALEMHGDHVEVPLQFAYMATAAGRHAQFPPEQTFVLAEPAEDLRADHDDYVAALNNKCPGCMWCERRVR